MKAITASYFQLIIHSYDKLSDYPIIISKSRRKVEVYSVFPADFYAKG